MAYDFINTTLTDAVLSGSTRIVNATIAAATITSPTLTTPTLTNATVGFATAPTINGKTGFDGVFTISASAGSVGKTLFISGGLIYSSSNY